METQKREEKLVNWREFGRALATRWRGYLRHRARVGRSQQGLDKGNKRKRGSNPIAEKKKQSGLEGEKKELKYFRAFRRERNKPTIMATSGSDSGRPN